MLRIGCNGAVITQIRLKIVPPVRRFNNSLSSAIASAVGILHEMQSKILVIEDEPAIVTSVSYSLRKEGYEVATATDGQTGLETARRDPPDLIVLDVMLPRLTGLDVCRAIRRSPSALLQNIPIIMLTARTEEVDRVVGLEIGADDYVTKPFSMRELVARVKSMLRRSQSRTDEASAHRPISLGAITLDPAQRRVTRNGCNVVLKPREFDLLACLMRHPGQVFTRDHLLARAWGSEFSGDMRTVDVHIRWLREKLEEDPGNPQIIETIRGVGYRSRAPN